MLKCYDNLNVGLHYLFFFKTLINLYIFMVTEHQSFKKWQYNLAPRDKMCMGRGGRKQKQI